MKKTNKKNLQKLVPFAAAVFVLALVTAGCENVVLQKLLRNPNKKLPQDGVVSFGIDVSYTLGGAQETASSEQITARTETDRFVKVPYGTTSGMVADVTATLANGGNATITYSPASQSMALPSKKPVTVKVADAGGASKTYSVYFVVCPEAYYVSNKGNDRNSGDSKERPFRQLKTALDAASDGRVVNKVIVMDTLTEANAEGIKDDKHTFDLSRYGTSEFPITISGMDGATLKAADTDGIPNGKGVMVIQGESYLVFENITFTGGDCAIDGGGLRILAPDSPTPIMKVTLGNGTRIIGNSTTEIGGGIFVRSQGSDTELTIRGAEISHNRSAKTNNGQGGGIYAENTSVTITNSTIDGNEATGNGSGIYSVQNADFGISLSADGCIFSGNTGNSGKVVDKYVRESNKFTLAFPTNSNTLTGNSPNNDYPTN